MGNLIPKSLLENIPNLYETERSLNPICHIKLFTPTSIFTWYIIEISKDDLDTCYGYTKGFEGELGYFSLNELNEIRGNLGLKVEIDNSFNPTPLGLIRRKKWKMNIFIKKLEMAFLAGLEFLLSLTNKDKKLRYKIKKQIKKIKRS